MNTIVTDVMYDPVLFNPTGNSLEKGKKVAQEVESLFISQLLKEMEATVERDEESMTYSEYEDTYRSLFHQEMAKEVARAGGIGLQDMVKNNLVQLGQMPYEKAETFSTRAYVR
jgi:Rod binding domain-containing protein